MAGRWDLAKELFPDLNLDDEDEEEALAPEHAALSLSLGQTLSDTYTPDLSNDMLMQLQEANVGGKRHPSPLLPAVAAAWKQCCNAAVAQPDTDPTMSKLAGFYLRSASTLHASKEALGKMLSLDPKKVESSLQAIASTLTLCDRADRLSLESLLSSSACELLLYVDLNRYDETPMLLTVKQPLGTPTGSGEVAALPAGSASAAVPVPPAVHVPTITKQAAKSKVFAVDHGFAMLLKVPSDMTGTGPQYITVTGKTLTWLQILERTTASQLKQALGAIDAVGPSAASFALQCRLTTTDAAAENFSAERGTLRSREDSWTSIHLVCMVHQIALAHTRTFSLMQEHISGMVNLSLSLAMGSAMAAFRDHLARIVRQRLLIIRGFPSQEVLQYRHFILELFCVSGRQRELRHFLLSMLPNGDWRRRDAVEVYVAPAVDINADQLTDQVVQGLVVALSGRVFTTYPQSRWIGCDVAVDEVGLCEAVHGLLSLTYASMLGQKQAADGEHRPQYQDGELADLQGFGTSGSTEPISQEPAGGPADEELLVQSRGEQGPDVLPSLQPEPAAGDPSAEALARRKQIASQWLRMEPLPQLMLARLCLRPMTSLLRAYIERSGDKWEQTQRAAEVEAMNPEKEQAAPRQSNFLEFVRGTSEKQFFAELQSLRHGPHWAFLPKTCWHLQFQSLGFRLMSRMGCMVHQVLVQRARQYPARLFRLLIDHDFVHEFAQCPACCQDEFTKAFAARYREEGYCCEDALACLRVLSMTASVDTVHLEWSHGRVQRMLSVEGVHTHRPAAAYLNSQYVCQKHQERKRRVKGTSLLSKWARAREGQSVGKVAKPGKRKRGGGGTWRAFTSERIRGSAGPTDWTELSAAYQEAKRLRTQEYQRAERRGEAATQRHSVTGQASFGPKTRALRRKQVTRGRALLYGAAARAKAAAESAASVPAAIEPALAVDLSQHMSQLRKDVVSRAKARRAEDQELLAKLDEWRNSEGGACLETLLNLEPALAPLAGALHPVPQQGLLAFEWAPNNVDKATQVADLAASTSRRNNLLQALQADWEQKSSTVKEDRKSTEGEEQQQKDLADSPCLKQGMCVCCPEGKRVLMFRNRLLRFLKEAAPKSVPEARSHLIKGRLCLCCIGESAADEPRTAAEALLAEIDPSFAEETQPQAFRNGPVWWHIGLQYLQPFRPTVQRLEEVGRKENGNIVLQQTGEFQTDMELCSQLHLEATWQLQLWEVVETVRPLPDLLPDQAEVRAFSPRPVAVWPPAGPGRPRGRGGATGSRGRGRARSRASGRATGRPSLEPADDEASEEEDEAQHDEALEPLNAQEDWADDDLLSLQDLLAELDWLPEDAAGGAAPVDLDTAMGPLLPERHEPTEEVILERYGLNADPGPDAMEETQGPLQQAGTEAEVDMPPPPAPPQSPPQPDDDESVASSTRTRAELTCTVPGGLLTYYSSGAFFTATCNNDLHGRCVMTRSARVGRRRAQGRPLGFLTAWLAAGNSVDSKEDHWNRSSFPGFEARMDAREALAFLEGGQELLDRERAQEPGEATEPDAIP